MNVLEQAAAHVDQVAGEMEQNMERKFRMTLRIAYLLIISITLTWMALLGWGIYSLVN